MTTDFHSRRRNALVPTPQDSPPAQGPPDNVSTTSSFHWRESGGSDFSLVSENFSDAITRQTRCFIPAYYVLPRGVPRCALHKLDMTDSPDHAGEVTASSVVRAFRNFDNFFGVDRDEMQRIELVRQLQSDAETDRIRWHSKHAEALLSCNFMVSLNIRERIYFTLDMSENSTIASQFVSVLMVSAILLSVILWILGTMPEIDDRDYWKGQQAPEPPDSLLIMEEVCVWIFSFEYLGRLLTVAGVRREMLDRVFLVNLLCSKDEFGENDSEYSVKVNCGTSKWTVQRRLLRFVFSPSALIDLLSVGPYWGERALQSGGSSDGLVLLRAFRLLRVARVFKLGRLLKADLTLPTDLFRSVLVQGGPAIGMTVVLIIVALIFFGSLMWFCERGTWYHYNVLLEQQIVDRTGASIVEKLAADSEGAYVRISDNIPVDISPFDSIPRTFWWALVTITTVGYGDAVPIFPWGKTVGLFAILYGAVLLGVPIGIIGATFSAEYDRRLRAAQHWRDRVLRERRRKAAISAWEAKKEKNRRQETEKADSADPMTPSMRGQADSPPGKSTSAASYGDVRVSEKAHEKRSVQRKTSNLSCLSSPSGIGGLDAMFACPPGERLAAGGPDGQPHLTDAAAANSTLSMQCERSNSSTAFEIPKSKSTLSTQSHKELISKPPSSRSFGKISTTSDKSILKKESFGINKTPSDFYLSEHSKQSNETGHLTIQSLTEGATGATGRLYRHDADVFRIGYEAVERLRVARKNLDQALTDHGDSLGIPLWMAHQWQESLNACDFMAGPELDRLSVRVLGFLLNVEEHENARGDVGELRTAWVKMCAACVHCAEEAKEGPWQDELNEGDEALEQFSETNHGDNAPSGDRTTSQRGQDEKPSLYSL